MSIKAIPNLATTSGAFAQLSATSTGEKRITISLVANHTMTTTTNNTLETLLVAGIYIMNDDPANLYFKSITATGVVGAFVQN